MPRAKSKTTIYTVAKKAKVSGATVSRALRNSTEVSKELRDKILRIAQNLNYAPRVYRLKQFNLCALIERHRGESPDLFPFMVAVLGGISDYANCANLQFTLWVADEDDLERPTLIRELTRRGIDGAVVLHAWPDSEIFKTAEREGFPYCSAFTMNPPNRSPLLNLDNEAVGYQAGRHLLELGHRHIAMLSSVPEAPATAPRVRGFRKAVCEAGLKLDEDLLIYADQIEGASRFACHAVEELLQVHPKITGLFCQCQEMAIGAIFRISQCRLSVPEHISVVSCDDFPETSFLSPPLTTVSIPNRQIGYLCARQVHRQIQLLPAEDLSEWKDRLRIQLVARGSTGPARTTPLPPLRP